MRKIDFIKNLEDFESIPTIFKDEVFIEAFEKAELAKFGPEEINKYEGSLKVFRDNKAVFDYAKQTAYEEGNTAGTIAGMEAGMEAGIAKGLSTGIETGMTKGKMEKTIEIAKALKIQNIPIDIIISTTGLSKNEIDLTAHFARLGF